MRLWSGATRVALAVCTTVAVCLGVGVATGAIPGSGGKISACYTKVGGVVRVIDVEKSPPEKCASFERALSWNQAGQPGTTGPAGPAGSVGPAGPKGDPGVTGATGERGPAGADGPAGPKGDPGDRGPAGADGQQGPAGPKGDKGDQGAAGPALTSFEQLNGLPCTRAGQPGHTTLSYAADGTATIRCNFDTPPPPTDADLSIPFMDTPANVDHSNGDAFLIQMIVRNDGPATAVNATVRLGFFGSPSAQFFPFVKVGSATTAGCVGTAPPITCELGNIPPNTDVPINVYIDYAAPSVLTFSYNLFSEAEVDSDNPDPSFDNIRGLVTHVQL